jgi:biotin transport system substrate-specific component
MRRRCNAPLRRSSPQQRCDACRNVVIYLIGLPWLAVVLDTSLERTLELGLDPFVAGDVLKLYLAGALLQAAWRLVERF